MPADKSTVEILYDGQCPVCTQYCKAIRLKAPGEELVLLDARQAGPLLAEVTAKGLDIDEGMVVRIDGGEIAYGADAVRALHRHIRPPFIERWLFLSRPVGNVTYRLAKAGRNLLLRFLGIGRIGNLGP